MIKKKYILIAAAIFISISFYNVFNCNVSDDNAIKIFKTFCNKIGIKREAEPWVLRTYKDNIFFGNKLKQVVIGNKGSFKQTIEIACSNKDIVGCSDLEQRNRVFRKYNIKVNDPKGSSWPQFLSEDQASRTLLSFAAKIGLTKDVEHPEIILDRKNCEWIAKWKRSYNGFPYENDIIRLDIMAVDGSFYSYGKHFVGRPCPTEVKISEEQAIEIGRNKVLNTLVDAKAKKHIRDYVVSSSQLKIIQPNAVFGFFTPYYRSKSRLAWVVTYSLRDNNNLKLGEDVNFADRFVIKIDAATGKVIGGHFTG